MIDFHQKTVWITGASSGIGKALAIELSERGARLILSSRRKEELEKVRLQCKDPENTFVYTLDLEQNQNAQKWVDECWEQYGPIDLVVNNAGLGQLGNALDNSEALERKMFEVNFFGNILLSKAILPRMLERGQGQIMAISSIAGRFGQAKLAAYSAAKAALILYYESLDQELNGTGVKIQVVSPGFVSTGARMNSLKPDGTPVSNSDPSMLDGMEAKAFVRKLIKVMGKNRFHSYIGRKELLAIPLHMFAPNLFYRLLGNKK